MVWEPNKLREFVILWSPNVSSGLISGFLTGGNFDTAINKGISPLTSTFVGGAAQMY